MCRASALIWLGDSLFPGRDDLFASASPSSDRRPDDPIPVRFVNVAQAAGISHKTIYGGEKKNTYLLETTGCGVAFFDYDNDG